MPNLPPPPDLPVTASHINMGHNAILVTVSDPSKRESVAKQCAPMGRIEPQQGSLNCFWVHLLATYTDAQIPSLVDWVKGITP